MINYLRTHLAGKLILSYILVMLVGFLILFIAIRISVPTSFQHHMTGMMENGNMMGGMRASQAMNLNLFHSFQDAVTESVSIAMIAALIAAIIASLLITRQIVNPIKQMQCISQRIAEGEYEERLAINANAQNGQLDELSQLAHSFNRMAEKLEQTELLRRQLIGDVTHELRTPLSGIKGYMEGLIDGVIPQTPETYQQVHQEADRLQRLVNDLQELSIIEAQAYPLNLSRVSVNDVVDPILKHFQKQYEDKQVTLQSQVDDVLPLLNIDTDRIHQVLTNLLGNALQYTPAGGHVLLKIANHGKEIVFSVQDSGIGLSQDQIPLVFNRFYRTDKSRTRLSGGSGVGLTVAKALVQAHHGRIWAESKGENQGSTFSFTLPIQPNIID